MANRTGQGNIVPQGDRKQATIQNVPQVQFAVTSAANPRAGQASFGLAKVMQGISERVEDRLDILAADEASRAGQVAGMNGIPDLQSPDTIRGRYFNAAAKDSVSTEIELGSRLKLNELEQKYQADPGKFKADSDAFFSGHYGELENFDPKVAQNFKASFGIQQAATGERIKERAQTIARDKQLESALRLQMAMQDDLNVLSGQLFTAPPEQKEVILANMMKSAGGLVSAANQIGPDGRPLFSARERVSAEIAAEQAVSEQVGNAWFRAQTDPLAAFETWKKGEAVIDIGDDQGNVTQMNLKEFLGPRRYGMAENAFMENLRSDLAMQAQVETAKERIFKKGSDTMFSDLMVMAQDGSLTMQAVEAGKSVMEPEKYLAVRTLAKKGGAEVSDGKVLSDLLVRDAEGEDIRQMLRQEYEGGKLSTDDYIKAYNQNSNRVDKGTKIPTNAGRDMLTQRLGVLSKELGMAQSSAIGQAAMEYEIEVENFIKREGRQPNLQEIRNISNDLYTRFSVLSVDDTILSLPLPSSMKQSEKLNSSLSSADVLKKIEALNTSYLAIHNGDVDALMQDEGFLDEQALLQEYYNLIKVKESGLERKPSATK